MEGVPTAGHAQRRGVRLGCLLSPLLFNLYVNMMFFYLDSKMEWNIERSIHAFIDDIFFAPAPFKMCARFLRHSRAPHALWVST